MLAYPQSIKSHAQVAIIIEPITCSQDFKKVTQLIDQRLSHAKRKVLCDGN